MDTELFEYSPIVERAPIRWPGHARIAFYVGLNVEHYQVGRPATSIFDGTASLVPDPLNYGWRDYGPRVGIWRLIESLDRHGIRPSALLNSDVCLRYPQIIEAGLARNWAWLAHGKEQEAWCDPCTMQRARMALQRPGRQRRSRRRFAGTGPVGSVRRVRGPVPSDWPAARRRVRRRLAPAGSVLGAADRPVRDR